jgi:hypothetical protein
MGTILMARNGKKLLCDICKTPHEILVSNTLRYPTWHVCGWCFEKVDALAAREGRWPEAKDFLRLANG